jgi:toxin HigB-1
MIKSFSDAATEELFYERDTKVARRAFPKDLWSVIRRKLNVVHAATTIQELGAVPGNRLESLKHTKPGFHSIRVNDRFRIVFRYEGGHAWDVSCEDYH